MKSFEIQEFGIENLALVERPKPRPGAGQVLLRMTAACLNYRDLMVTLGTYNPRMKRPLVPLSDGVGVVEEIGEGVTRVRPGDRVSPIFMQTWIDGPPTREKGNSALGGSIDGVLSEYGVFREEGLVHAPAHLSDVEAATLPCAAVTAWHALFEHAAAAPGDSVLIQGSGGVSTFALAFARAAGLRTLVTSSAPGKMARLRELGANETINYKENPDWDKEVRALTAGVGVDNVIEVGGAGTIQKSLQSVRAGGSVSVIGALSGRDEGVGPGLILMNSVRVQGIYVGSRTMFERMNRAIVLHGLKPLIDRVFPWTEFKEALRHMQGQQHFGKICLKF